MAIDFKRIRGAISRFDLENQFGPEPSTTHESKVRTVRNNAIDATLEALNAIPVVSTFSGAATIGWGAFKLFFGTLSFSIFRGEDDRRLIGSAVGTIALGIGAVALPGVGNVLNGIAAAKDAVDAATAAASPAKEE